MPCAARPGLLAGAARGRGRGGRGRGGRGGRGGVRGGRAAEGVRGGRAGGGRGARAAVRAAAAAAGGPRGGGGRARGRPAWGVCGVPPRVRAGKLPTQYAVTSLAARACRHAEQEDLGAAHARARGVLQPADAVWRAGPLTAGHAGRPQARGERAAGRGCGRAGAAAGARRCVRVDPSHADRTAYHCSDGHPIVHAHAGRYKPPHLRNSSSRHAHRPEPSGAASDSGWSDSDASDSEAGGGATDRWGAGGWVARCLPRGPNAGASTVGAQAAFTPHPDEPQRLTLLPNPHSPHPRAARPAGSAPRACAWRCWAACRPWPRPSRARCTRTGPRCCPCSSRCSRARCPRTS